MKQFYRTYFSFVVIALCVFFSVQTSNAQQRTFGLGVIIGEPTGISAKLWTSNNNAFAFGLGWSYGGDRFGRWYDGYYDGGSRVHFHIDYLWHAWNAIHSTERFPLYYGVGGCINTGAGYNSPAAVRGVIGIAWMPRETPIDIFLEVAPSLELTPSTGFAIDAAIGARYFF
ncbi:MAG: hypothetical protein Q8K98_02725 [Bacteroidota bacterium]|nr:hypothetical protein [Bacteroidota bacterium]